jgi:hypothetical protein
MKEDEDIMNEKMLYESPELEVISFDSEDIITSSLGENEIEKLPW